MFDEYLKVSERKQLKGQPLLPRQKILFGFIIFQIVITFLAHLYFYLSLPIQYRDPVRERFYNYTVVCLGISLLAEFYFAFNTIIKFEVYDGLNFFIFSIFISLSCVYKLGDSISHIHAIINLLAFVTNIILLIFVIIYAKKYAEHEFQNQLHKKVGCSGTLKQAFKRWQTFKRWTSAHFVASIINFVSQLYLFHDMESPEGTSILEQNFDFMNYFEFLFLIIILITCFWGIKAIMLELKIFVYVYIISCIIVLVYYIIRVFIELSMGNKGHLQVKRHFQAGDYASIFLALVNLIFDFSSIILSMIFAFLCINDFGNGLQQKLQEIKYFPSKQRIGDTNTRDSSIMMKTIYDSQDEEKEKYKIQMGGDSKRKFDNELQQGSTSIKTSCTTLYLKPPRESTKSDDYTLLFDDSKQDRNDFLAQLTENTTNQNSFIDKNNTKSFKIRMSTDSGNSFAY